MQLSELSFSYPTELIATRPSGADRVMYKEPGSLPSEIKKTQLLQKISPGDLVIVNDTRVEKRRIFAGDLEILFVHSRGNHEWDVLFPARAYNVGDQIMLPEGLTATLKQKSLPQVLALDGEITVDYFLKHGEPALPPYIQKARGRRKGVAEDQSWYQSAWAENDGSVAAPTASLHFSQQDLVDLKARGVEVATLTLHVGLGTFLPIKTKELDEHQMHAEWVHLPAETLEQVRKLRERQGRIWSLGTTVCRALESWSAGLLEEAPDGGVCGHTSLFIQPGYRFQEVDVLMTNFHQPESTLLALVGAFAGLHEVLRAYEWAIERKFKLFSYGHLTVWTKEKL